MFSSTEMQDLGLGSLPDLEFAERLDGVYNNQDLVRDGQVEDEYSSLFKELEEFNDGLMRKEGRGFSTNFTIVKGEKVKSSGPNILSQAVTEAAIFEWAAVMLTLAWYWTMVYEMEAMVIVEVAERHPAEDAGYFALA